MNSTAGEWRGHTPKRSTGLPFIVARLIAICIRRIRVTVSVVVDTVFANRKPRLREPEIDVVLIDPMILVEVCIAPILKIDTVDHTDEAADDLSIKRIDDIVIVEVARKLLTLVEKAVPVAIAAPLIDLDLIVNPVSIAIDGSTSREVVEISPGGFLEVASPRGCGLRDCEERGRYCEELPSD
jgi:hypothetical protein